MKPKFRNQSYYGGGYADEFDIRKSIRSSKSIQFNREKFEKNYDDSILASYGFYDKHHATRFARRLSKKFGFKMVETTNQTNSFSSRPSERLMPFNPVVYLEPLIYECLKGNYARKAEVEKYFVSVCLKVLLYDRKGSKSYVKDYASVIHASCDVSCVCCGNKIDVDINSIPENRSNVVTFSHNYDRFEGICDECNGNQFYGLINADKLPQFILKVAESRL